MNQKGLYLNKRNRRLQSKNRLWGMEILRTCIKPLIEMKRASESTIKSLISIGVLYVDETGIHANEPGIYSKKEEIPTQTANPSGDK